MIEILWKQDIDIGIPRDHFLSNAAESPEIEYEDQETVALKVKQTKDKVAFYLPLTYFKGNCCRGQFFPSIDSFMSCHHS